MMFIQTILRDLLYALHALRKNLVFACVAIITLALGIGANTAIFSIIHAVLLKPLNYPDPARLVQISVGATPARFKEMKSASQSFSGVGAFAPQEDVTLLNGMQPEVLKAAPVSAGFLQVLGTFPLLGRDFLLQEDSPGGPPVAIISAELWQRRFNGDTHVVGKKITLASGPHTVIGVLPARFQFPFPGLDVWLPQPEEWPAMPVKSRQISPFLTLFGRLRPTATIERAKAEIAVLQHPFAARII